jgi:hypothetical protein
MNALELIGNYLIELGFTQLSDDTKTLDFPLASFNTLKNDSIMGRYDRRHFTISLRWDGNDDPSVGKFVATKVELALFHDYRLPGMKNKEIFSLSRQVSSHKYDLYEPGSLESMINEMQKSEDMGVAGHRLVYDFYGLE